MTIYTILFWLMLTSVCYIGLITFSRHLAFKRADRVIELIQSIKNQPICLNLKQEVNLFNHRIQLKCFNRFLSVIVGDHSIDPNLVTNIFSQYIHFLDIQDFYNLISRPLRRHFPEMILAHKRHK